MSDQIGDKAGAVVAILNMLTVKKIALGVVAGFFAIMGYTAWESRVAVATAVVNSPTLAWTVGIGVGLLAIGLVVHGLIKRIDELNLTRVDELSARLKEIEAELIECRVACKAEAVATHETIKETLARIEQKLEK